MPGGCYSPKVPSSFRRLLAPAICLALIAGACGQAAVQNASPQPSPAPLDLRVAVLDPGTLDPPKITTDSARVIAKQVCDTLVSFDQETGALQPGIAESWTIAPDARKVTFQLRPGVKFHNGRDLVAEDYVYSLSRLADPRTASTQHFLLDKVMGYTEVRASGEPTLSGVKAPAPDTLEIELIEPFAEFPTVMTSVVAGSAVPREEIERSAEEFAANPICTGPYKPESARTEEGIKLVRHDGYYGANGAFSEGGRGLPNSLTFRFAQSESDAYNLLDAGDVHVSPVDPSDLAAARRVDDRVTSGENGHVAYIGLPVKKAPFDNLNLRRALALSVDRREIVSGLLGDSRKVPDGLLPSSVGPGAAAGRCAALATETADSEAARAARSEAQVTIPESVNVYLNEGGGHEQWLQAVLDQWKRDLDINGVLKPNAWQPYVDYLASPGADGPFRLGWTVGYPSPEALYAPLFSSASLDNFSRYSSPDFDAAMNRARAIVDDAARMQAYSEAGSQLCGDIPIIPMWFGLSHLAFGSGIEGAGGARIDIFGDPVLRELRQT